MGVPYDVYVLASDRSAGAIARFLEHFAPVREEITDEYAVPEFAETKQQMFENIDELISYLVSHPQETYGLYWRCIGEDGPRFATAFFLSDGAVILGLACDESRCQYFLNALKSFADTDYACIAGDQPPPDSAVEFRRWCEGA